MTREEAIAVLRRDIEPSVYEDEKSIAEALDMAIEALQFAEHFDLLKEFQSLQEVVRCKDCKYYNNDYMGEWCGRHQAPVWVKENDFCSWGEMKGGDTE